MRTLGALVRPRERQRAVLPRGGLGFAPHRRDQRAGRLTALVQRVREPLALRGYRAASAALGHIPTGVSVPAARAVFRIAYHLWPHKRHTIEANASHILGLPPRHPTVRRLARRIYATYARYIVELMRLPWRPVDEPARLYVEEHGRGAESFGALYARARAEDRGLIGVTAHIGSIETMCAAYAARGWPLYAVADDTTYPGLFQLLTEQRRRWGVEIIAWRRLREMYRILRRGAILGLVVDWGYRADDVPVRLFGDWTTLPAGPAILAARTRAWIVPFVSRRREDGRFEAMHDDPFEVPDDSPASIAHATQRIADALEAMVRAAPEQWYTFKPIWPGTADEARELAARHAEMLRSSSGAATA